MVEPVVSGSDSFVGLLCGLERGTKENRGAAYFQLYLSESAGHFGSFHADFGRRTDLMFGSRCCLYSVWCVLGGKKEMKHTDAGRSLGKSLPRNRDFCLIGKNIFLILYQHKKVEPLNDIIMMKVKVFASLMLAGLPFVLAAQSNDDLYFVPKKKAETKKETVAAPKQNSQGTTVYSTSATSTPVVVKDVAGNTRDVDEYNRRYTSRENTFSMQNDTLYIQENRIANGESG